MAGGSWLELSQELTAVVKDVAATVVRIDGGRGGSSSGVVWSPDGVVVTTGHGLDEDDVEVGLASGETSPARVVGRDPSTDLAVVRLEARALSTPAWVERPLEVGQLVFSVTRPGRGPRVALGLVSRLGDAWRTTSGGKLDRYVELDLGLHPGFSGGLVVDGEGKAVGLATAGLVRGTPLAVPQPTLSRVVRALLEHGGIRRGYLGIASLPVRVPAPVAQRCGQELALLVTAVDDDSPAASAALMVGDLLLSMDGTSVGRMGDLLAALDEARIGEVARARIARGGALQELDVIIGARGGSREEGARP
jgi:S1-C subfamily serine protease